MIGNVLYLLLFVALTSWMVVVVIHALKSGEMWARGENAYRTERPIAFWLCFSMAAFGCVFGLCMTTLLIVGMWSGW